MSAPTTTAALTVDDATVTIGGATIVRNASLRLASGEVTVIIGPNGAGKSTLLSVAAGIRTPTTGSVRIGDDDIHSVPVRELARRRAMMPQSTAVAFPFTVREVVELGRSAAAKPRGDQRGGDHHSQDQRGGLGRGARRGPGRFKSVTDEALALADIEYLAHRTVTALSGGERQRVAFARVIAQAIPVARGNVILLDEPTAAMDIAHSETTLRTARELASRGAAVAIVLHDLDAAASYADRLVLMSRGSVVRSGTVAEVCDAQLLSQVYATPIEVMRSGAQTRVLPQRVPLDGAVARSQNG